MGKLTYLKDVIHNPDTAITVGTFDGVHLGHRQLISLLVEKARSIKGRSVVVTFDPHPREVLHGGNNTISLLTSLPERVQILEEMGVDEMVVIPFDRDFSLLSSHEFIEQVIFKKIGVKEFIIGYDHQFGKNREGTIETVRQLGESLGFNVTMVTAHEVSKTTVSSTSVRKALANEGNVELAADFLGRPYPLKGLVIHGDKKGRTIGFPTANIRLHEPRKVIPQHGVYVVVVEYAGKRYKGMMNIGVRPTVTDLPELRLEVHILEFDEDIYGKMLNLHFVKRIRNEKKFSSFSDLKQQLEVDKQDCINAIKTLYL